MADLYDDLGYNPWFSMGAGILAESGRGVPTGQAVGRGILSGMQNLRRQAQVRDQADAYRSAANYREFQMEQARAKAEREQAAADLAAQQREQLSQWADQNIQDPMQRMFFQQDPEGFFETMYRAPSKPGRPVAVRGPNGQPMYVTPEQALGMEPFKTPLVNVEAPAEITQEQKVVGKHFGELYTGLQKAASQARESTAKLNRLDALLDEAYTGSGGKAALAAKRGLAVLGIDTEGIGEAEAAEMLSGEMALQLRNPAGGAGMPGAMSDRDREFLQSMVPGLATTREGRKLMIETRRKLNQRSQEVAKMARDYRKQYGRIDEGFEDMLAEHAERNPLFDDVRSSGQGQLSPDEQAELDELRRAQDGRRRGAPRLTGLQGL